ncbi:vWA domain-containing protein [Lishizhenia sp.]|uniref:vWA domain-containing protein n=1 Tax=Lishizhenia sp. TaxID=2497594 RepID=UPI00299DB782|nr:VWA domain-containing protein [Lishizhenia sp.]MDX1445155.1 VWA domain-containing protein [Lishizhenia sp.]
MSAFAFAQQDMTRILFILDASNSMNGKWGYETKIDLAKEILTKTVDSLSGVDNLELGLRVYGHQSPITATYQDCADTKLEVPFYAGNESKIKGKIKTIEAKGTTPIARSLEAAAGDFPDNKSRNIIILITDGVEECDDEPCVIADKLRAKGIKISPFIIGLGLDTAYLAKFDCVGQFANADDKKSFEVLLKTVVDKALVNTTVQVNLNRIDGRPLETNSTLFFYEAGTKKLVYSYMHTLNENNLPDTIVIDPNRKYDLVVNTLPRVEKKNITIKKYQHNIIEVDCPQGYLDVKIRNKSTDYYFTYRVVQADKTITLNHQELEQKQKYIVGEYKVEIYTLPRITMDATISQSKTTTLTIDAPGRAKLRSYNYNTGQIFVFRNGEWEWVCDINAKTTQQEFVLQPGNYKIVYRDVTAKATEYTKNQEFRITSNRTISINL